VAYVWRFVEVAYFREPRSDIEPAAKVPLSMAVPAALLVAATVYFGLDTTFTVGSAAQAADALLAKP
jgi:multicomponent Na+:H+ antiporter subunit D